MTKEELDKLKGKKIGGDVVGLAENRQADEALYGPEGRVVGGNSPPATAAGQPAIPRIGGHSTAVFRQDGASIVREPDVITPDTALSPEQRKVPGGMTNSGLSIRFAPTVSDATRREVMQPIGTEEPAARAMQKEQFDARQGLLPPRKEGEMFTRENSPGLKDVERVTYNREILSGKNQLANTALGGQNQLATTALSGQNQLANTKLSNTGRIEEQERQNDFTGKQNDITRAQAAEQKALDRVHEMSKQRGDIAGRAFVAGLGGNAAQQIQNSPADSINFAGLQVPAKEIPDKWTQIHSEDDSGVRTTVGAFNQQTGERRIYPAGAGQRIGGNSTRHDLTEEEQALLALRRSRPDAYEKLRAAMGR